MGNLGQIQWEYRNRLNIALGYPPEPPPPDVSMSMRDREKLLRAALGEKPPAANPYADLTLAERGEILKAALSDEAHPARPQPPKPCDAATPEERKRLLEQGLAAMPDPRRQARERIAMIMAEWELAEREQQAQTQQAQTTKPKSEMAKKLERARAIVAARRKLEGK